MPTIRLVASAFEKGNSNVSVTNVENAYHNIDNDTFAEIKHNRSAVDPYTFALKGFNFSDVPANAVVTSYDIKFSARQWRLAYSSDCAPKVVIGGTTYTSDTITETGSNPEVISFNLPGGLWESIKATGNNFKLTFTLKRATASNYGLISLYGAEIYVNYTVPAGDADMHIKYNGDAIADATVEPPVSVMYNGTTITSVDVGQTKTLNCSGKVMSGNVSAGGKTLNCAGKYMDGNIVIELVNGD